MHVIKKVESKNRVSTGYPLIQPDNTDPLLQPSEVEDH